MAGCLSAHDITYTRHQRPVFRPLSFEIHTGLGYDFSGKNGSGKSTLLKITAGILLPSDGQLYWNQQPLNKNYQDNIVYLGHENGLKLGLSIEENWLTLLALQQCTDIPDILTHLDQFQLPRNTLVKHLSAGQKRKAALARFALLKKTIWILDEPFNNLDTHGKDIVNALFKTHLQEQGIILMSTPEDHTLLSSFKRIYLC